MTKSGPKSHTNPVSRRFFPLLMLGGASGFATLAIDARAQQGCTSVDLKEVSDHLDIQRLVFQYAHAVDSLSPVAFSDCFAQGAYLEGRPDGKGDLTKWPIDMDFARKVIEGHRKCEQTMHLVMNHQYTVNDRTASGVTYGVASWVIKRDAKLIKRDHYMRYKDELTKIGNRWHFSKRHLETLYTTEGPVASLDVDLAQGRKL